MRNFISFSQISFQLKICISKQFADDADKVVDIIKDHYLSSFKLTRPNDEVRGEPNEPKLCGIYLYPIKSCAPCKVSRWPLGSGSLLYDRSFVIMQGRKCLTQKILPMLCMIKPKIDLERKILMISNIALYKS